VQSISPSSRRRSRSRRESATGFEEYGFGPHFARICEHPPICVLKSEEGGWSISAGAEPDCRRNFEKFDLLLNLTGDSVLAGHVIPVAELARWRRPPLIPEIVLDWPDMGVVNLPRAFWVDLVGYLAQKRVNLLIFCFGGHGRTGTAIASIMTVCGWESTDAIAWVRANYCPRAIETKQQEEYVHRIARESPEA
jgi:hypothetical protein